MKAIAIRQVALETSVCGASDPYPSPECLDYIVVFGERSLRRTLCTSLTIIGALILRNAKDAPESRRKQWEQEEDVIEWPVVGGLHHHYERRAA